MANDSTPDRGSSDSDADGRSEHSARAARAHWRSQMPASSDTGASAVPGMAVGDIREFFAAVPHWAADAALSPDGAQRSADALEQLAERLSQLPIEPDSTDGPAPSSFPPPSDRLARAAATITGFLSALDGTALDGTALDGESPDSPSVIDQCRETIQVLQNMSGTDRAAAETAP